MNLDVLQELIIEHEKAFIKYEFLCGARKHNDRLRLTSELLSDEVFITRKELDMMINLTKKLGLELEREIETILNEKKIDVKSKFR